MIVSLTATPPDALSRAPFIADRLFGELVPARELGLDCGAEVYLNEGYPAVWNHEGLYEAVCRALGPDAPRLLDAPALAAEDFSFYQRRVPGLFFFLGVGDTPELHAPNFCFDDEAVLPRGASFLEKLAFLP